MFLPNVIKIDPYIFEVQCIPFQSWCIFWDTVYISKHDCWTEWVSAHFKTL